MSWLKNLIPSAIRRSTNQGVPEGLWTQCDACQAILYRAELERALRVCPKCDHHHYLPAKIRLEHLLDPTPQPQRLADEVGAKDILRFRDSKRYRDRLSSAQKQTEEQEALVAMQGYLYQKPVVAVAFEYHFIGGSMGSAVGERFVQAVHQAQIQHCPFICFSASGGARMQEGLLSLFQMAKTSAALKQLSDQGLPFISVLTDPTMGGVAASLAMLGDVIVAEPRARLGFAGPRVIEQTVRETLPEGFQRSEFLLEHGAVDIIMPRAQLREKLAGLLAQLMHWPLPAELDYAE